MLKIFEYIFLHSDFFSVLFFLTSEQYKLGDPQTFCNPTLSYDLRPLRNHWPVKVTT